MSVSLSFQSTGTVPGKGDPVAMRGVSLTIGRGAENDLVLPDPDRMLSKRHCAIEDHNGSVIVVDFSTNGTFLNYGKLALGAVPTPLNDGDVLSLGPYEILVTVSSEQATEDVIPEPMQLDPVSHGVAADAPSDVDLMEAPGDGGDFLDDLLGGRDELVGPSGVSREEDGEDGLLPPLGDEDDGILAPAADAYEGSGASAGAHSASSQDHFQTPSATSTSAIPDNWDDDFLAPSAGDPSDPFAQQSPDKVSGGQGLIPDDFGSELGEDIAPQPEPVSAMPEPVPVPVPVPDPVSVPEPELPTPTPIATAAQPVTQIPPRAAVTEDAAARAFLKALGADGVTVPAQELTPTLSKLGQVLRVMVEGMREILMTRTSIKSEFRIQQTMIQAGGNNPLKFSISPEQAIEAMVKPSSKGYVDATEAAKEALQDIKAHEIAMVTGMESALRGILARLDPKALEDKISTGGGLSNVLKSKKARYWEVYETMYAEISDQAENDFHELFAKEFARAYREQMDKLK